MVLASPRQTPRAPASRLAVTADATVDVALVLAIDVSGSVSQDRLMLQRRGYSDALCHPGFAEAVRSGPAGRVALTFVQWSEARRQEQSVAWRLIDDAATARRFAQAITDADLPMPGWTSISAAIDYSARLIASSGLTAGRKVIDVSGDGSNNDGRDVTAARDDAVAAGITVNGLPIVEVEPGLDEYYRRNVIGGPGAFVVVARDIGSFAEALLRKLLVEVAYTSPAPAGEVKTKLHGFSRRVRAGGRACGSAVPASPARRAGPASRHSRW
jgi:hypothetical protein